MRAVKYTTGNRTTHTQGNEMRRNSGDTRFISFPDLYVRWSISHQTLERLVRKDPRFPSVHRFGPGGRFRFFRLDEVERYERASVVPR